MKAKIALFVFCTTFSVFSTTSGAETDIWLVNTRQIGTEQLMRDCRNGTPSGNAENGNVRFSRMNQENSWKASSQSEFLETLSPQIPVVFLFHGNWTDSREAVEAGFQFRQILEETASSEVRIVIWSWPSDRILLHVRPDIRMKAALCDREAAFVAKMIENFPENIQLGMIGFSFGARIALQTAEQMAENHKTLLRNTNLVLLAPALNTNWFTSSGRYKNAIHSADSILILYNSSDRRLKLYPLLQSIRGPEALGFTGPAFRGISAENRGKIKALDLWSLLGHKHAYAPYIRSRVFQKHLADFLSPTE